MKEVAPCLWIGSQADFAELDQFGTNWTVVFAARDPWHRELLGYKGRGAPTDSPEYLFAQRGNRLYLNLIDGPDPKYVNKTMVDKAVSFIEEHLDDLRNRPPGEMPEAMMIACNQGHSRSPTLAMLYLAPSLPEDFDAALAEFRKLCPEHSPAEGIKSFARIHWRHYRNRTATAEAKDVDDGDWAVDKSREIWATFCHTLESDPTDARDRLLHQISTALRDAAAGKMPTQDS